MTWLLAEGSLAAALRADALSEERWAAFDRRQAAQREP
jgi:hypothetical protein